VLKHPQNIGLKYQEKSRQTFASVFRLCSCSKDKYPATFCSNQMHSLSCKYIKNAYVGTYRVLLNL